MHLFGEKLLLKGKSTPNTELTISITLRSSVYSMNLSQFLLKLKSRQGVCPDDIMSRQ